MNKVLPRVEPTGRRASRIITGNPFERVGRSNGFARLGSGISARTVLMAGGIARGGMVRVESGGQTAKKVELPRKEISKVAVVADSKSAEKPKTEGLTETEERLTGLLEAAQEMKPLADKAEERGVSIPEQMPPVQSEDVPLNKRRRRRKGKRDKGGYEQGEGLVLS